MDFSSVSIGREEADDEEMLSTPLAADEASAEGAGSIEGGTVGGDGAAAADVSFGSVVTLAPTAGVEYVPLVALRGIEVCDAMTSEAAAARLSRQAESERLSVWSSTRSMQAVSPLRLHHARVADRQKKRANKPAWQNYGSGVLQGNGTKPVWS